MLSHVHSWLARTHQVSLRFAHTGCVVDVYKVPRQSDAGWSQGISAPSFGTSLCLDHTSPKAPGMRFGC